MKNNDMRGLLGIMRNHRFLLKEDDQLPNEQPKQENTEDKLIVTNINDNDKQDILDIINSIKMYKIFVRNIEKTDEDGNQMILINAKYSHNNYNYPITIIIKGDRESSTIDIESPKPLVFDANSESSLFEFYSLLYNKFKDELYEKCGSILGIDQNEQI
jgi:hypothetical protein